MKAKFFLFITVLLISIQQSLAQVNWRKIGNDLETAELQFSTAPLSSSSLVLFRTSLQQYRVGVIRASEFGWKRSSVRSLCKSSKAILCINGSFFDEQGKPLGLLINRGMLSQKLHRGGDTLTGILIVSGTQVQIVHRDSFQPNGVLEALQAGPRLLSKGAPVPGVREALLGKNLSGLCIDKKGSIIIYRVTSSLLGGSLKELQNQLVQPGIDCQEALNFDGGGSSELYLSDQVPGAESGTTELQLAGEDPVPVALGLFLRESR